MDEHLIYGSCVMYRRGFMQNGAIVHEDILAPWWASPPGEHAVSVTIARFAVIPFSMEFPTSVDWIIAQLPILYRE